MYYCGGSQLVGVRARKVEDHVRSGYGVSIVRAGRLAAARMGEEGSKAVVEKGIASTRTAEWKIGMNTRRLNACILHLCMKVSSGLGKQ